MSNELFTPSPWFRKGKRVYWKKPEKDLPHGTLPNGQICLCKSAEDWPECDEEARANAQLISVAPEMFDFVSFFLTVSGQAVLRKLPANIGNKIYSEARRIVIKARVE